MDSLTTDLWVAAGLLAFLAFICFSTLKINQNRKHRVRHRKLMSRVLDWKIGR